MRMQSHAHLLVAELVNALGLGQAGGREDYDLCPGQQPSLASAGVQKLVGFRFGPPTWNCLRKSSVRSAVEATTATAVLSSWSLSLQASALFLPKSSSVR